MSETQEAKEEERGPYFREGVSARCDVTGERERVARAENLTDEKGQIAQIDKCSG